MRVLYSLSVSLDLKAEKKSHMLTMKTYFDFWFSRFQWWLLSKETRILCMGVI